jgi:hypothetical protein
MRVRKAVVSQHEKVTSKRRAPLCLSGVRRVPGSAHAQGDLSLACILPCYLE